MDDPQGPYEPTWTNRRKVVFVSLPFYAVAFLAVVFFAPPQTATAALWIIGGLAGVTITYYLIGPSWEGVRAFTALMGSKK